MKKIFFLLGAITIASCTFARQPERLEKLEIEEEGYDPWYTGPLLTPSASNLPKQGFDFQPYLAFITGYGIYDAHWKEQKRDHKIFTVEEDFFADYGITDWLQVSAFFATAYKSLDHHSIFNCLDTVLALRFQILRSEKDTNLWNVLLVVREIFPSGKYQNLSKKKKDIEGLGSGFYQTQFGLHFSKMFFWFIQHPINYRLAVDAAIPSSTHVKGFNSYGGGIGAHGKVTQDTTVTVSTSFEFSFTQHWVFAFDAVYTYVSAIKFKGYPGKNDDGTLATNTLPESHLITLAPAIEYNFSENLGLIAGAVFSAVGKNSSAFASGVISLSWVY